MKRLIVVSLALVLGCHLAEAQNLRTCTPEPTDMRISYGDVVTCTVDFVGDLDVFRFDGTSGEWVSFQVTATEGDKRPALEVRAPSGKAILSDWNYGLRRNTLTLPETGSYQVRVWEVRNDRTMPYVLLMQRVIPPIGAVDLHNSVTLNGEITTPGWTGLYTIYGAAGDEIVVQATALQEDRRPAIALIAPSGKTLFNDWNYGLRRDSVTLAEAGTHFLWVYEARQDRAMKYSVLMQCVGACPAAAPVQPAICTYWLTPTSQNVGSGAGTGSIGVSTAAGCPWIASINGSFLTATSALSGTGPGTIRYSIAANTQATSRTATITAQGQTATLNQAGTAPYVTVSPSPLEFSFREGGTLTAEQVLSVRGNVAGTAFTTSATVASGGTWLAVRPASGTAPANLIASVDASKLAAGTYTGSVEVNAPGATPAKVTVPVSVKIESAGPAKLSVDTAAMTFALAPNGEARSEQRMVANSGGGSVDFSATVEGGSWLTVSPGTGSATLTAPVPVNITASPAGLAAGTYSAVVVIKSSSEEARIPVMMTVSKSDAKILLSQTGLSFTAVSGGGAPSAQTFGILNEGKGTLSWTAKVSTLAGGSWLKIGTASGTVARPLLDVSMVNVSVETAALAPGEYYGKIEVAGATDNSPQYVTVLLTVLPEGSDPGPEVRPSGLIFVGAPGAKSAAQAVTVTNVTGQSRTFNSSQLTFDGGTWLGYSPLKATVAPNVPGAITVQLDNKGLTEGVRRGVLTLLFDEGRAVTVKVLSVAAAGAPGASEKSEARYASSCQTPNLRVESTSLRDEFVAAVGQPVTVEAKVVDDCGNLLVPEDGAATPVVATFSSGDAELRLTHVGTGVWTGTWRPVHVPEGGGGVTVKIRAAYVRLGSTTTMQTGEATLRGSLRSTAAPVVAPGALLHAASFAASAPVAPGGLVTLFGANMADKASGAGSYPLPSTLEGTEVMLGGQALPLLYSSAGQINAQVPYGLTPNTQHQVVVRRGSVLSVPEPFTVAAAQPGIFTKNMQGTGQGIIMKSDQLTMAEAATPASRGEVIVIYCSGLGAVTPAVKEGEAATVAARTVNETTLTIGGVKAEVQYAGVTPGFAGLYQINAVVPANAPSGNEVPVVATVAGQVSNTVTMAVK